MHLVLHGGKKLARRIGSRGVIVTGGVDVEHFLPKHFFAAADIAYAPQQLFKVTSIVAALEALVIQQKALLQIAFQGLAGPAPKLRATVRAHPVADVQNGFQVVVINQPLHAALAFRGNYYGLSNSSISIKFAIFVDNSHMPINGGDADLIQLRQLLLRQPERAVDQTHLNPGLRILGLVQQKFTIGGVVIHGQRQDKDKTQPYQARAKIGKNQPNQILLVIDKRASSWPNIILCPSGVNTPNSLIRHGSSVGGLMN